MPIYKSKRFRESALAHKLLDGLTGLEIGGSAHNAFGLDVLNVDYTNDMNTVFKQGEIKMCGEAMPVDVVANGDNLPFPDRSFDFVISSHVIEHFFDPIKAIKEWIRVSRKYVYIICPQPYALESDQKKLITGMQELVQRHTGDIAPPPEDTHEHYTRWTSATFCEMCNLYGWKVAQVQDPDDKVGNGFAIVIDVSGIKTTI